MNDRKVRYTRKLMSGYVMVYFETGRPMLEHRYLMEQHLGRKLDTEELVHHINGIKHDNDLSNLQVVTQEEHTEIHFPYRFSGYR